MSAGYPNDASIVFEPLSSAVNGDTVTFDLTTHSRVMGDSLPGTFSNPGIANRQMRVVFEIETGCGFDPTKTVAFYRARGFSPCSDPAIGSDILVASNPVNVEGTEAPYETQPVSSVDGALQGCGGTIRVHAAFELMGGGTTARDTSVLIVPPGIAYVPGSLICESPNASSCPAYSITRTNADGLTEIRFALPENLPEGTDIAFSFEIEDQGAACAAPAVAIFRNTVTRDPLSCGGIPCLTELEVATGQDTVAIPVQKPTYSFTDISLCLSEDSTFQLHAGLVLSGLSQSEAEGVTVNAYCADANGQSTGALLGTLDFTGSLSAGSLLPIDLSGTLCADATGIWLEAVPTCGCDTTTLVPVSGSTGGNHLLRRLHGLSGCRTVRICLPYVLRGGLFRWQADCPLAATIPDPA